MQNILGKIKAPRISISKKEKGIICSTDIRNVVTLLLPQPAPDLLVIATQQAPTNPEDETVVRGPKLNHVRISLEPMTN
jgi:hypothetical protein